MRNWRPMRLVFLSLSVLSLGLEGAIAQSSAPEQPKAAVPNPTPSPAAQSAPVPPTATPPASPPVPAAPAASSLNPKDLQGLDVFASGGQQLGKVTKVTTLPDGKVKDVEVQSGGFLGMFKTTYLVPAEKVTKKGGRIELSMTSDQAKSLGR